MDVNKILYLGRKNVRYLMHEHLIGTTNIFSFRVIVTETSALHGELTARKEGISSRLMTFARTKLMDLYDWVAQGHILVVVIDGLPPIGVNSSEVVHTEALKPFSLVSYRTGSGYAVDNCGPAEFAKELQPWMKEITYSYLISGKGLVPLLEATRAKPGPQLCVGGYVPIGEGLVFFMPGMSNWQSETNYESYMLTLSSLCELMEKKPEDFPEWSEEFLTSEELGAKAKIADIAKQIGQLNEQLKANEIKLSEASSVKSLVLGSGDDFKDEVADALREIGFSVLDGPHPRADLLATDGKGLLIIEAKGFDGSVSEKPLTQLARWVPEVRAALTQSEEERNSDPDIKRYADVLAQLDVLGKITPDQCKPMMVIGTYRKTRFDERTMPDFPDQVLRNVARSNVCAMTGFQLLSLLMECRSDGGKKSSAIKSIFETNGVYNSPTWDWRSVFKHLPPTLPESE
jgi:hypothetical protein